MLRSLLHRRTIVTVAGVSILSLGCGYVSPVQAQAGRKYRIALSNSYIGNQWRIEMENVFKAALQMEPYKSQVDGSWFNSGNDVSRQSQQLSNLISERVDAILIDAASPTALNGILAEATRRGILVVSFDNLVTAPSALRIEADETQFGMIGASWLAEQLKGRGNVIMVTGVSGTTDDTERNKGVDTVFAKHPGIKVVNRYSGMWDSSIAERNTTAILPSLPKIDGIWCSGGTDGVLKAFIAAGRTPLPPTAGEAENGFRKFMVGYMGQKVDGISVGGPPFWSILALELARRVLGGNYPRRSIVAGFPTVTSQTVDIGQTVFPALPDSFFTDFTDSGEHAVIRLCASAALQGKPCPGTLSVRLPDA